MLWCVVAALSLTAHGALADAGNADLSGALPRQPFSLRYSHAHDYLYPIQAVPTLGVKSLQSRSSHCLCLPRAVAGIEHASLSHTPLLSSYSNQLQGVRTYCCCFSCGELQSPARPWSRACGQVYSASAVVSLVKRVNTRQSRHGLREPLHDSWPWQPTQVASRTPSGRVLNAGDMPGPQSCQTQEHDCVACP